MHLDRKQRRLHRDNRGKLTSQVDGFENNVASEALSRISSINITPFSSLLKELPKVMESKELQLLKFQLDSKSLCTAIRRPVEFVCTLLLV